MKILALANVEVAGYGIVKRGEIIDYAKDKIDARIAANFLNAADESRLKAAPVKDKDQPDLLKKTKEEILAEQDAERAAARKNLIEKLGEDGIREQLAEYGIPFRADTPVEKLCDLLNERIDEAK